MASMIVTMRVMPESPEVDLTAVETEARATITKITSRDDMKITVLPFAFGLNSMDIIFVMDEKNSPDEIEDILRNIEGVQSVEVTDMRRAIG